MQIVAYEQGQRDLLGQIFDLYTELFEKYLGERYRESLAILGNSLGANKTGEAFIALEEQRVVGFLCFSKLGRHVDVDFVSHYRVF